ncbi:related to archipelago beta form (F-box-WD40 repeat protein) [Serendipita indica DSM 11827]|uniref:Related to archipelago beta form (F-box-WD40 repeat protein) n=1 Tax=Serendipita indica (strain DSM 11827) TaxID=1109443 RepID=G4TY50_SERID|nr:related to archipelago beta form (F-box-WD40 repeat protein) [Serendipita indica DSM 11827]
MSASSSSKPSKQRKNVDSLASSSSAQGSSKKAQMYNTVNVGLTVGASIAEVSDILAPLKAACLTTKTILEVAQANSNQEEWTDLVQRLKRYMSALEERTTLFETYPQEERVVDEAFRRPLIHYVEFLETMHDMVVDLKEKRSRKKLGLFKAFSKVKADAGEILKMNQDIEDQHRQFMEALGVFTALRVQVVDKTTKATEVKLDVTKSCVEATKTTADATKTTVDATKATVDATKTDVETLLTDVDANAILQLPTVAFVASSVHNPCLQGTREAVLNTIWQWADDDTSDKPIFWLCDIAGSGKSTVAMTAVESWRSQGVLGGRFFFSISSNETSSTDRLCSTIARDLAHHIRELAPHVAEAVKHNPSFMRCSLEEQFELLVSGPLHHRQGRMILVIDALDEYRPKE